MDETPGISDDYVPMDAKRLLERFNTALNTRDLENLLRIFQVDFEVTEPARSDSTEIGLELARQHWESIFTDYPDFKADLLRSAIESETIWSEWRWHAGDDIQPGEGNKLDTSGVIIFGAEEGLLAWARVYAENFRLL